MPTTRLRKLRAPANALRLAAATTLAIAAASPQARAIDPFFPTFGNNGYDVRHYAVTLDVDGGTHRLSGRAVLTVKAEAELAKFALDLSGLEVTAVRVNGVPATYDRAPGKLRVKPVKPVGKGSVFSVDVAYRGVPKTIDDPTVYPPPPYPQLGWTNWNKTSYVVSEPVGAGTWYPVNDEPTDKATYKVTVTVNKPYKAVSNGVLKNIVDLGAKRRFVWEQAQPMASYLALLDIDRYQLDQRQASNGVTIRTYRTADTPRDTLQALYRTPAMMAYFEKLVGPYPFDSYGAVTVGDPALYYALETQTMSTFPKDGIDEATVAHELAHQWFGDAVTVAQWRDLWLAEGFATYLEFLWDYRGDRGALDEAFNRLYAYAVQNKIGPTVVSVPQDIFADNTYYRGALTLQALRLDVGDKAFFATLKSFYLTYRYGNATSADFIKTAVKVSGKPRVRDLLQHWLYDETVPALPGAASATALQAGAAEAPPKSGAAVRRH